MTIEVGSARGRHMTEKRKMNIERVKKWFLDNPGCAAVDCAKALKLSRGTVSSCINEINSEVEESR